MSDRIAVLLGTVCLAAVALSPGLVAAQAPEPGGVSTSIVPGTFAIPFPTGPDALTTAPEMPLEPEVMPPATETIPPAPEPAPPAEASLTAPQTPAATPAEAAAPPAAPTASAAPPAPTAPGAPVAGPLPPERVTITADKPLSIGVAAIVNDTPISDHDLDQRVLLFFATSGVRPTTENMAQIRVQVLRAVEDEVLEAQEAAKHKITVTKADVDKAISNLAMENKIPVEQILMTITNAGVTVDTFRQQITSQLLWQKVVAARYGTDILINEQQVNDAMERLRKGADKPQFLLSEIFIAVDRPEDEDAVGTSAKQIADQLNQGAPFASVAGQFSQSPSAADGGDIGWVVQGQLADEIDHELLKLRPGQVSPPIRAEGGFYVLMLRDRREPIGTMIEENPKAGMLDPDTAIPLDRLLVPLPPNPDPSIKERAMDLGKNVQNSARSCNDLATIQKQLQGSVYQRLGQTKPADLDQNLRDALLKTEPGKMVDPYLSPAGLEFIMRCDEPIVRLVAFTLPSRAELEQQLFVQQMTVLAKSYLRDLRRNAVVETR